MAGYISFKDMFDGGGAGKSGPTFEGGGIISAIGNAANIAPRGYHDTYGDNDSGNKSPAPAVQYSAPQSSSQKSAPQRRRVSDRGILDFFDGGGIGRRGPSFEGSPFSTILNTMGVRPQGSQVPNPQQEVGLYDFVDGGGYGKSGPRFEGSNYSVLANALGVKPMGYEERLAATRTKPRRSDEPAETGFGNDFTNSGMNVGQKPYQISPPEEEKTTLEQISARHLGIDPFQIYPQALYVSTPEVEQNTLDLFGREVNPLYANYPFMRY